MGKDDSLQIELIRIFCILTMMWVHVSPGLTFPSYVNGGPMDYVGLFLGQTMGRISVTTLSFISGYLFWRTGVGRPLGDVARRLTFAILLPMLVWSVIFLTLASLKETVTGHGASAMGRIVPGFWGVLNAISGLAGPTANESLFFIRDLAVATLILRISAPLIRRAPLIAIALALGLLALPETAPILFRPNILVFMVLGALAAQGGMTIGYLSRPRLALGVGLSLTVLTVVMTRADIVSGQNLGTLHDLLRRAGIGFLMLALTRGLASNSLMMRMAVVGRHGFLAYLSHVTVVGILWTIWQHICGTETQPAYLIFYLLTPPFCFALAAWAGSMLDHWPPLAQILLRGKRFAPNPDNVWHKRSV